jgi:hypothetical protein
MISAARSTARHLATSILMLTDNVNFDFMDRSNQYGHVALSNRVNGRLWWLLSAGRVSLR